jgi:hypothetical protein
MVQSAPQTNVKEEGNELHMPTFRALFTYVTYLFDMIRGPHCNQYILLVLWYELGLE